MFIQENRTTFFFGIIIVLLVFVISFGGAILYRQSRSLAELREKIDKFSSDSHSQDRSQFIPVQPEAERQQARERIINNTNNKKSLVGIIKKIDGNIITVEAQIPDVKALDSLDPFKPMTIPLVMKNFRVFVENNTKISSGLKLSDFKVNDMVAITASQPIYGLESFTASQIEKIKVDISGAKQKD